LERPVVILAEPERAHAASLAPLLYVALTRAQHHLVVLGTLPTPEAVEPPRVGAMNADDHTTAKTAR
jgi:ATP-dependent exoDNAse (exonuclease V) beta subunit